MNRTMVPYPIFLIEPGSLMIDLDGRFVLPQQKSGWRKQTAGTPIHRRDALTDNALKKAACCQNWPLILKGSVTTKKPPLFIDILFGYNYNPPALPCVYGC